MTDARTPGQVESIKSVVRAVSEEAYEYITTLERAVAEANKLRVQLSEDSQRHLDQMIDMRTERDAARRALAEKEKWLETAKNANDSLASKASELTTQLAEAHAAIEWAIGSLREREHVPHEKIIEQLRKDTQPPPASGAEK